MRIISVGLATAVLATIGLVSPAYAAAAPADTSGPQPVCYNLGTGHRQEYPRTIAFVYVADAPPRECDYPLMYQWLAGARDATVRGQHGGYYQQLQVNDDTVLNGITVTFGGGNDPAQRYVHVKKQDPAAYDGPWEALYKTVCKGGGYTSTIKGDETTIVADYLYHVGEVAKTNAQGYVGPHVYTAKLISSPPPDDVIIYSPNPECYPL